MTRRLSIVVVAWFFPPSGGGGAQRPVHMASGFHGFGDAVTVLTPKAIESFWAPDDDSLSRLTAPLDVRRPAATALHHMVASEPRTLRSIRNSDRKPLLAQLVKLEADPAAYFYAHKLIRALRAVLAEDNVPDVIRRSMIDMEEIGRAHV